MNFLPVSSLRQGTREYYSFQFALFYIKKIGYICLHCVVVVAVNDVPGISTCEHGVIYNNDSINIAAIGHGMQSMQRSSSVSVRRVIFVYMEHAIHG